MAWLVKLAEICRNPYKFYNNDQESVKALDQELIEFQESDVQRAFLNLSSPYVFKEGFKFKIQT